METLHHEEWARELAAEAELDLRDQANCWMVVNMQLAERTFWLAPGHKRADATTTAVTPKSLVKIQAPRLATLASLVYQLQDLLPAPASLSFRTELEARFARWLQTPLLHPGSYGSIRRLQICLRRAPAGERKAIRHELRDAQEFLLTGLGLGSPHFAKTPHEPPLTDLPALAVQALLKETLRLVEDVNRFLDDWGIERLNRTRDERCWQARLRFPVLCKREIDQLVRRRARTLEHPEIGARDLFLLRLGLDPADPNTRERARKAFKAS